MRAIAAYLRLFVKPRLTPSDPGPIAAENLPIRLGIASRIPERLLLARQQQPDPLPSSPGTISGDRAFQAGTDPAQDIWRRTSSRPSTRSCPGAGSTVCPPSTAPPANR